MRVSEHRSLWQPRFHDRIIRDDKEQYFIERYISLNPLLWHLDKNNTAADRVDPEDLRHELKDRCGLDEYAAESIIERRAW